MGKKRRVCWIVGGLVSAVALFFATTYIVIYNGNEARLDRAVEQIVEEYGFELEDQTSGTVGTVGPSRGRAVTVYRYRRAPMGAETAAEIVAILREACPSFKYDHPVFDDGNSPDTISPWIEAYTFWPEDQHAGWIADIEFLPNDDRAYFPPYIAPHASLRLWKYDRPSR